MIKNSILGKLCPVFHLRSAAVASRQNLNHGCCGRGPFLCVTVKRSTPWWGGEILRVGVPQGREGGSTAVENYTTSINHLVPTVSLSLSLSEFSRSLPSPSHFLPPRPLHGCASFPYFVIPLLRAPTVAPLDFCPLFFFFPLHRGLYEAPAVTVTTPLYLLLHFHCGLFTCFLY